MINGHFMADNFVFIVITIFQLLIQLNVVVPTCAHLKIFLVFFSTKTSSVNFYYFDNLKFSTFIFNNVPMITDCTGGNGKENIT